MSDTATVVEPEVTTPAAETTQPPADERPSATAAAAVADDYDRFVAVRAKQAKGEDVPAPEPAAKPATTTETPTGEAEPTEAEKQAASDAGKTLAEAKGRAEKRKQSIQGEINDLVGKRSAARKEFEDDQRRLADARRELAETEARIKALSEAKPAEPLKDDPKPKVNDFQEYEQFTEALTAWKARQIVREEVAAVEKRSKEAREKEQKDADEQERARRGAEAAAAHATRMDAFRKEHADFDEKLADNTNLVIPPLFFEAIPFVEAGPALIYHFASHPDQADVLATMPVTPTIRDAVVQSPAASALLSHLVSHKDECARIAKLSPARQLVEMGKIEARLTDATSPGPSSAAVVVSKADPPIKPVGSTATATTPTARDLAVKDDYAAFRNLRNQAERDRRVARR